MQFATCGSGKHHAFVPQGSFSMFKLFRPDFEAILLSVRELSLVSPILRKCARFLRVILCGGINKVISANKRTQGNKEWKGINLANEL